MRNVRGFVYGILFAFSASCIDPLPLKSTDYRENIVIEGFLSSENEVQRVSISRTSPINQKTFIPETGASVWVEDSEGGTTIFGESDPGRYQITTSGLPGKIYTLRVTLKDGREYASAPVTLRNTPPIRQIAAVYRPQQPTGDEGIYFSVYAGDSTNQTRYYRWEFEVTYEIQTPFPSSFEWLGGNNVQPRSLPVSQCWASDTSRNILIASSHGLSQDVISDFPIHFLPAYSFAMRIKYSMLLKQYSLTAESYSYWTLLRQINQSQGSLFDLQPGTIVGNMRNLNNGNETVLGYFDACTQSKKRVFFTPANFSTSGYKPPGYLTSCQNLIPYEVPAGEIDSFMAETGTRNNLLISESVGAYDATLILRPRYCCDCTDKGTNIKPSFWQ